MAKVVLVAGAHGIMVEEHLEPGKTLSDGPQSSTIPGFEKLMGEIKQIKAFLGY
jgi:3-deoxy-7-phosphoheptulonate synthase